ncbi:MAG TPA: hypothetical protein VNL18_01260 [Gemmatimonadales bacterium]|nr:hypothetical protein [Gemmatimonadales bacterium]
MFDRMILREIAKVAQGQDTIGTDANTPDLVDTNFVAIHAVGLR